MERSHGRKFQAMSGAPIKKLPASTRVSQPSIPVADRGGEEVNVGFGDFGAGRSNQLLKDVMFYSPERNNTTFSCEFGNTAVHVLGAEFNRLLADIQELAPRGKSRSAEIESRLWRFISACQHAHWMAGVFVMTKTASALLIPGA
jgi:hypothetical protein